jgi:hypothetical protein
MRLPAYILQSICRACLISISLFLISCSLSMVSEQDEKLVWEGVKCECPECRDAEKPIVLFTQQPLYENISNKETEVMGIYMPSHNIIIIRELADIKDYEHECRHACKDDKWDEYYHGWIAWERDMCAPMVVSTLPTLQ